MDKHKSISTLKVIVVEDNPASFELIKIACRNLAFKVDLIHCANGVEFFHYLKRKPRNSISFFLLDLRNPVMGGKEILKKLKRNSAWSHVPSIIFSSLDRKDDIMECRELGAKAYFFKPMGLEEFEQVIEKIFSFCSMIKVQKKSVLGNSKSGNIIKCSGPSYFKRVQPIY